MTASLDARLDQALEELAAIKKELALLEAALCQCQPKREHAAHCPVTAQQARHTRKDTA